MIYVIVILLLLGAAAGFIGYGKGQEAGRAEVQAEVTAANQRAQDAADKLKAEAANHITDMEAAFESGEGQAKTRYVYIEKKGAQDVANNPNLSSLACTLPPDAVANLNAARGAIRGDPGGMRVDAGGGPSATARPAADPGGAAPAVRGADASDGRVNSGPVPTDDRGRVRPMGKVRPAP